MLNLSRSHRCCSWGASRSSQRESESCVCSSISSGQVCQVLVYII